MKRILTLIAIVGLLSACATQQALFQHEEQGMAERGDPKLEIVFNACASHIYREGVSTSNGVVFDREALLLDFEQLSPTEQSQVRQLEQAMLACVQAKGWIQIN